VSGKIAKQLNVLEIARSVKNMTDRKDACTPAAK
jgi:hypothetical protein